VRSIRLIRPTALRPGDTIAVIAPAGAVQAERLAAGIAFLEARGFNVRAPRIVTSALARYFSAGESDRRADLLDAFADPVIRAVWCARGGYGSAHLLPKLEPEWFRSRAKLAIGFSDATALLHFLVSRAGVAALHGPMVAHDLVSQSPSSLEHLFAILAGGSDWRVDVPRAVQPGEAEAPLLGGCLTVLASLAGTPFQPSFTGAIALLEDTNERPLRRVDRLLTQLRQSRMLEGVRGIVFGAMPNCGEADELCATIADCLGDLGIPIGFGAPFGHGDENFAAPLGVRVRLTIASRDATPVSAHGPALTVEAGTRSESSPAGSLIGIEPVVS
jgi:muramoyltetrapeptide carboxypeptidase